MNHSTLLPAFSALLWGMAFSGQVHAGRPMNVDDAGVVEAGTGQVEAWYARQPGGVRGWTVAPAYSPAAGIELSAAATRDIRQRTYSTTLQGKFLFRSSQDRGCNPGATVALLQTTGVAGTAPSLNGLLSCNQEGGAVHVNVGAARSPGGSTLKNWGLAAERELGGYTAHVEWFGQKQSAPVFQLGLRTEVAPGWQLDGSVGRTRLDRRHERLYSLGFVHQF